MTELRRASTVCLVRDRDEFEILMVQRPHTARFMPGAWVFPGGVVDPEDAVFAAAMGLIDPDSAWRVAALRELIEETGVWITQDATLSFPLPEDALQAVSESDHELGLDKLIYFANWITPTVFPIRFDTRFYLAIDADGVEATFNSDELIDGVWVSPSEALARESAGTWDVAFPTRKTLELIAYESSAPAVERMLRSLEIVPPIEPRLHVGDAAAHILMPDDPGFAEAASEQNDPTILARLARVVALDGHVPAELKRR
jgi:recombination protein RecT